MSKNVAVFVDVANLYYSARGQDVDVDYVALLKAATKGRDLIRAYAYSGLDPENENQRKFIDFLGKNGYKVVVKDIRKFGDGRVKANLDIELVVDLFRLADRMDIAVVVSGDGDFAPAIRALQDKGVRCEVISFRPNTSSDLLAVADEFLDIMKVIGIGREKKRTGMSAPAMPAKEVVPEFGFREASPQIAAAALAAIKGAPEQRSQPAANGDADAADDGAESRSRRRRRGGRGRGRGRGREPLASEAAAATADTADDGIGWTEVDDLSEFPDLTEEREYTFAEADPETLAELGIAPDAQQPATGEPETGPETAADAEAKPRRRRRTKKEASGEAVAPVAEAGTVEESPTESEPAKPRRRTRRTTAKPADEPIAATEGDSQEPAARKPRRRRSTKAAEADAGTSDESRPPAEPESDERRKPTRSRRTTRAKKDGDAAAGGGPVQPVSTEPASTESASNEPAEGQGIWQRFRSARGN